VSEERDELVDTREAARYLGLAEVTLRQWRWLGVPGQPPFLRVGSRAIRYRRQALAEWALRRESQTTKQASKSHGPGKREARRARGG